MKKSTRTLALLLVLVFGVLAFAGCGKSRKTEDKTLVVGYSPFNSKFSPFFSESGYDSDAMAMTQVALLTSDRTGAIIQNGIKGETKNYNGTDYTYYGPADLKITENADGTVYYDFTLRKDIKFSDGEPVTIDDVIFSMYVLCDPTYDGSSTLYAQPIQGMDEYRGGMTARGYVIGEAGEVGYTANDKYTEEQYNEFWAYYNGKAHEDFVEEIQQYVISAGYDVTPGQALQMWNFPDTPDDATLAECWDILVAAYDGDVDAMVATESAGSDLVDLTVKGLGGAFQNAVQTGESAPNISGIQKIDDYSMRVVLTKVDATAIYHLGIFIAPMHYYGDKAKYDYANNKFGFDKGDLSTVRAKTATPMGAGAYKFIKFDKGVINYEANENYYLGAPLTRWVNFIETKSDDDKLNGVVTGTIDITDPSFNKEAVEAIMKENGGQLTGSKITTNTVDNLGYGFIGQNAQRVKVGNDPGSEASKNLRKAFATIFSVYRDVAIDSYYGERASVINYPISNTSWAAPRPSDDGYALAFSKDVNGNPIYTSEMDANAKYDAALQAALGFFEAAGYTVENGKLTAAPDGAKLSYEFWIPGDGTGDHPSFMICNEAKNALAKIGMELVVKDLANSSDLWNNLDVIQVDMWAAAWSAGVDPDMYQIYYSDVANGPSNGDSKTNPMGGPAQGGSNYQYCIADADLDKMILDARSSTDQAYRKSMYKACLDIVIDWAVETPVYQRQNAIIFSTERVMIDTVTPDITTFYGWMAEIQNIRAK